jgi:corrinoid protein of di/trimethylamine methyltransferase
MDYVKKLTDAVMEGDEEIAAEAAREIVDHNLDLQAVVAKLTEVMRELGGQFEKLEIFLSEMIVAADAMIAAMDIIGPKLAETTGGSVRKGTVVLGAAAGDMHEIGKNIVATCLRADGFDIVDLGRDVNSHDFVKKAEEAGAAMIGISSLMTTTMPSAKEVIDILNEKGLRSKFKVMVGGAPTNPKWAKEIGADAWAASASQAVELTNAMLCG